MGLTTTYFTYKSGSTSTPPAFHLCDAVSDLPAGVDGDLAYVKTTDLIYSYNGSAWQAYSNLAGAALLAGSNVFSAVNNEFQEILKVDKGLRFPATQVASAGANDLDDYEEGTWTPIFLAATPGTPIYSTQSASYTKIGREVFCQGRMILTSLGGASGGVNISGLPFTCGGIHSTIQIGYGNTNTAGVWIGGYVTASNTIVVINFKTAASTTWGTVITAAEAGAAFDVLFSFHYTASN